ncbi:hypothetical protein [Planomonospora parontospora]|uniref:hypothetical protein n=1 Tax=Planomonospora parontospora TaxID=58119 RepID=UPI0016710E03|nr:hypothetical protein [Planomonospora parontospora]GGL25073.1 hypothetical protein GCM10014719_28460 [Planomonospora parontospora subsp. antibiotica]GII16377.1 hypothetical protein Ppa05_31030 [Planomonospora parontospora subsp. antibiotica]
MIRRILAGAVLTGVAGLASLAVAGPASAGDGDYGRGYDRPNFTYIDRSNHNEVLNDLLDIAILGIIAN